MKRRYGSGMTTYGHVLPGAGRIAQITTPTKEAAHRLRWMEHYTKHHNGRLTCRYFGIPPKTFYKWFNRYTLQGLSGLEPLSRKPHRLRTAKTPLEQRDRVTYWRTRYPAYSKYKIAILLEREDGITLSPSTVGRIFRRHDLFFRGSVPAKNKRFRQAAVKERLHPYHRSTTPGELGEADMKHVSFFGQRRYFFVGVDCVSKRLTIHVGTSASSRQASTILDSMAAFPFPIRNVRVDNGSENLKDFAAKAASLNMGQYFTRFRRPKDKPFVERVIGTIEREFIQRGNLAFDLEDQRRLVEEWVVHYNTFRPHQALNYLTPEAYERTFYPQ